MIAMPTKKVSSCNESNRVKILANDVEGYQEPAQITMRDLEMIQHSHKQSDVCSAKTQSVRQMGNVFEDGNSLAILSHNSNNMS